MSLRHAIGLHPAIGGFGETLQLLENKFGLKEGENHEASSILTQCAEFIETNRNAYQEVKEHMNNMLSACKIGFTKTKMQLRVETSSKLLKYIPLCSIECAKSARHLVRHYR